ncbi:hypothetical protein SDC9_36625 [bioreactor metagenome]|uniref:Uncharacterized protein n=1 Tax=bioreactor metagenome TaxID=1076179 RepID=A0A644VH16_9ZZZZ
MRNSLYLGAQKLSRLDIVCWVTDKLPDPFYEFNWLAAHYCDLQLIFELGPLMDSNPIEASIASITSFSLSLIKLPPSTSISQS